MSLANVLKAAREKMKIDITKTPTVNELADRLGVSASYLHQLENGTFTSASIAFLKKYANETGTPIQKFIDQIEG